MNLYYLLLSFFKVFIYLFKRTYKNKYLKNETIHMK
jgi:hypothetical protein